MKYVGILPKCIMKIIVNRFLLGGFALFITPQNTRGFGSERERAMFIILKAMLPKKHIFQKSTLESFDYLQRQ